MVFTHWILIAFKVDVPEGGQMVCVTECASASAPPNPVTPSGWREARHQGWEVDYCSSNPLDWCALVIPVVHTITHLA